MLAGLRSAAQEVIINNTTLLIAEGKYNDAEKYLDSIIGTEPKNVTALMMKGNVLLNYALMQTPAIHIITLQDESIFSADVATVKNNTVVIPKATALKVEALWKQCLVIDSSRQDIQKGLCSLYGMSLMKTELLAYLPVIAHSSGKGEDFAFTLVEYAKLFQERGDKEGSYAIYKKVAELYPNIHGILCLLSGAYFENGDIPHAREYAEKGMSTSIPDLIVCSDALDIYTAIGEPAKVLSMLQRASKDPAYKDYSFYHGIYQYAHYDSNWRKSINTYLNQFPSPKDSNAVYNAAGYMVSKKFTNDYSGIMGLLNYNLNDFGTKLLAERAIHDYKDSVTPYIIAVQVLINDKDYKKANELLSTLVKKYPAAKDILYYSGYCLYAAGDYKAALQHWSKYTEAVKITHPADQDIYLAAPYYFTGASYLRSGNKEKAIEYFKLIVAGKDDSKYAYLAKVQLDNLAR